MATALNSLSSNITIPLIRKFMLAFENARVLSKNVNSQLLSGEFDPSTGDSIFFKRPHDYFTIETDDGDITNETQNAILSGKVLGKVQQYITVPLSFREVDQALRLDQLDQIMAPIATRMVTTLELNMGRFMVKNTGLVSGDPDVPLQSWLAVANAGATLQSTGVPMDGQWNFALNPFAQVKLSDATQRNLGAGGVAAPLIVEAHKRAVISNNFANLKVMTATTLATYLGQNTGGDRLGTFNAVVPDQDYIAVKDTFTQDWAISGFGSLASVVPAGTILQVNEKFRLNLSTREPMIDANGDQVKFTVTVVEDSAAFVAGAGTVKVTGPAIFESEAFSSTIGQYNTINFQLETADTITMLGTDAKLYQPNMFWHRDAYGIGSVPLNKLHATDTIGQTKDGMQIRVTRTADAIKNTQLFRFDMLPAFAAINPFFAGQAFGETP